MTGTSKGKNYEFSQKSFKTPVIDRFNKLLDQENSNIQKNSNEKKLDNSAMLEKLLDCYESQK